MGSKPLRTSSTDTLSYKFRNKVDRQALYLKQKKSRESTKRDERLRRKREEDKNPQLREERRKRNIPSTLERKRTWDDAIGDGEDGIGVSVDVERIKRLREDSVEKLADDESLFEGIEDDNKDDATDEDSMLGNGSSDEDEAGSQGSTRRKRGPSHNKSPPRAPSPVASTVSTKLDFTPEALIAKFPSLFSSESPPTPKVLITTSLNSTLHSQAQLLTSLFPNATYIPRSAHRYSHKFSVRDIAKFASNREYTVLMVVKEDQKQPTGLTITHLPKGPSFYFSISGWVEGKKLPGHGNPTEHVPELILNNFQTPLGLLTAHLFRTLFPPQPELEGRQVVTLHNQRDYIFVRRHRYVFRDKRPTEKSVTSQDGKEIKGVEGIRAGLQELGPRFTLKLRRVDKGIGRAGSDGVVEWEWKGAMEKQRTKFQL